MNKIETINFSILRITNTAVESMNKKKLLLVTSLATAALTLTTFIYSKWSKRVEQGLARQMLDPSSSTPILLSPQKFVSSLCLLPPSRNGIVESPQMPKEWVEWIVSRTSYGDKVASIFSFHSARSAVLESPGNWGLKTLRKLTKTGVELRDSLSLILGQGSRSWQTLTSWEGLVGFWISLSRTRNDSPQFVYDVLFDCMAPATLFMLWQRIEGIRDLLLQTMPNSGSINFENHRAKVELLLLGITALLYWNKRKQCVYISDLTKRYVNFQESHKGLYLVPAYKRCLDEILSRHGSIVWYYPTYMHTNWNRQIGGMLAEMIATATSPRPNAQILEFDVAAFLSVHGKDGDSVRRGWQEALRQISGQDTWVVFSGFESLKNAIIPTFSREPMKDPATLELAREIKTAIESSKVRFILELTHQDKEQLEENPGTFLSALTCIQAPHLTMKEMEGLYTRLYSACDISYSLEPEDVKSVVKRLYPMLPSGSSNPFNMMATLEQCRVQESNSWIPYVSSKEEIEQAERWIEELQQQKQSLLRKIWHHRRGGYSNPFHLERELMLIQHVALPIYKRYAATLKRQYIKEVNLVSVFQKRLRKLVGVCLPEEREKLKGLYKKLQAKIKGQDLALEKVSQTVSNWRSTLNTTNKPLVLFFAGPSGVGKSETATQLAYELRSIYGIMEGADKDAEENILRVNLNNSRLGAKWDKAKKEILRQILLEPTSVIILDEWDKMNSNDRSNLLELLDNTSNTINPNGFPVDKRHAIFVLTANVGTTENSTEESIKKDIQSLFGIEKDANAFISRLNAIVPFQNICGANEELLDQWLIDLSLENSNAIKKEVGQKNYADARQLHQAFITAAAKILSSPQLFAK